MAVWVHLPISELGLQKLEAEMAKDFFRMCLVRVWRDMQEYNTETFKSTKNVK